MTGAARAGGRPSRPVWLLLPACVAVAVVVIPLLALGARADWPAIPSHLSTSTALPALRLSLLTTTCTVLICLALGTPLAWLMARSSSRASPWLRAVITVPLVLPPVVGGVALLMAWGRNGVLGAPIFHAFGFSLPFTPPAVVVAETFVSLPFYVIAVEAAMRGLDPRLDGIAATLGASELRIFRTVALPLVAPGIASGAALAWARALGEFGATITFAGNFTGRTQTAPLAVYVALEQDPQTAIAISLLMLVVSVAVLGALRGRWLR